LPLLGGEAEMDIPNVRAPENVGRLNTAFRSFSCRLRHCPETCNGDNRGANSFQKKSPVHNSGERRKVGFH
jgi:hypothetical protein